MKVAPARAPARQVASRDPPHAAPQPDGRAAAPVWRALALGGVAPDADGTRGEPSPRRGGVKIGAVDDPFEREADSIADHVMRMPVDRAPPLADRTATPAVQRICAACDEETIRRMAATVTDAGTSEEPAGTFMSGGTPLPRTVREFYEPRLGRDLSGVRVHADGESAAHNDRFNALAFTVGSHVWMGRGQSVAPSFVLAHELAHVMQQSAPPALHGGAAMHSSRDAQTPLRRFTPYWEPYDYNGNRTHGEVLPEIGRLNGIFTEAPVPNADRLSVGYNSRGRADFYSASTTVGVYFTGHETADYLGSHRDLKRSGARFGHRTLAAPRGTTRGGPVLNVAAAPTDIGVGDLKPSHGTIEALEGVAQIQNYNRGFELARGEINALRGGTDGTWGSLNAHVLAHGALQIPERYQPPAFSGQTPRPLVIKQVASRAHRPEPRVEGRLAVQPDRSNPGIWNYFWVPTSPVPAATLPESVRRLGPEVERRIIDPLLEAPVRRAKSIDARRAPTSSSSAAVQVRRDLSGAIRRDARSPASIVDPFDYTRWRASHREITGQFGEARRSREFRDAESRLLATRANEALREHAGFAAGPDLAEGRDTARRLDKVDFWTGLSALPFGMFRRVFGRAFVTVARLFLRARDRFRQMLRSRRRAGASGGLVGAALKAAFTVLKLAAGFVIGRVVDRLMESLVTGVTQKLQSYIQGEFADALEAKLQEVEELRQRIERTALATVDDLLRQTIGPYEEALREIEEVQSVVSDIVSVVNLVRWGARVIACLSPPAWGCLWILGQAVLERLAQQVVETCWFQRHITPMIAGIGFVAQLPARLADMIIDSVRGFLPESLRDVFATVDRSSVSVSERDIECEEGGGAGPGAGQEELADAMLAAQTRVGEDRFAAFAALSRAAGVSGSRPLTPDDVRRIAETIEASGVSAEQMHAYATQYPTVPLGMPVELPAFLDAVRAGGTSAAEGDAHDADGGTALPPAASGPATAPPAASGDGRAAGDPGSGPAVAVASAAERRFSGESHGPLLGSSLVVLNARPGHTVGTRTPIDVLGFWHNEAVIMVTGIPARVVRRSFLPRGSSESDATHLVIHYELLAGARFDPIPNAVVAAGQVLRYPMPWGTGPARSR